MRKNRIQCPVKDRLFSTPKNYELVRYGVRKDIDYKVSKSPEGEFYLEIIGKGSFTLSTWPETTKLIRAIGSAPKESKEVKEKVALS